MSTGSIETIQAEQENHLSPTAATSLPTAGAGSDANANANAAANANADAQQAKQEEAKQVITYLLLIRHGENDWVSSHRLAGRTPSVFLNDKGKQQSADLATFLAAQPISAIYSSPLERCLQTAQPLADVKQLAVSAEPGLIEVEYGEWRGGDLRELSKLPEWRLVQHYPSSFRFPGGETLYEVQSRAVSTLEQIRSRHAGGVVAAFSHGDVIRLSVAHFMGVPLDLFQRVQISTASVSIIVFHNSVPSVMGVNYLTALPVLEIATKKSKE